MIPRYSDEKLNEIWSYERRLGIFTLIEAAVLSFFENRNQVPQGSAEKVKNTKVDASAVGEREKITRHDIIAFLEVLEERSGVSKGLHMGITSSDILDTATGLQIKESTGYIRKLILEAQDELNRKALKWQGLLVMGRTHNVHAEPTTLGLKLLNHLAEFNRSAHFLLTALDAASCGMVSGAVGTHACPGRGMEEYVLKELGLKRAPATNQVIQRDLYGRIATESAILGGAVERLALNIRLLSHTEIHELTEGFAKGQKGSSAMPHKKNPIKCERLSGMARLLRGFAVTALENIPLMHERDISHSSAERIILPDIFHTMAFMLKDMKKIVAEMDVHEKDIRRNIDLSNERYLSGIILKELMARGYTRKQGYERVQKIVFKAIKEDTPLSTVITDDKEIKKIIPEDKLKEILCPDFFTKEIKTIFEDFRKVEYEI